ncbi:MAG: hypothetical protein A2189_01465 [Paenibacillus sp. RIFOXYA1_FULL_44_5]|nr:MAG: hypothetical protein A2189_01465 [Paenibacillus sp. RIFOXYA1_FULL_44_5]
MRSAIESMLLELKNVTVDMLNLNLEEDEGLYKLSQFQMQQQHLTYLIDQEREISDQYSDGDKKILLECQQLQEQVQQQLLQYKDQLTVYLQRISIGKTIHHAYSKTFVQTDGFFIDKQK